MQKERLEYGIIFQLVKSTIDFLIFEKILNHFV